MIFMVLTKIGFLAIILIFCISMTFSLGDSVEKTVNMTDLTVLSEEFYPYNYMENTTPAGLAVDLLGAITREAGDEILPAAIRIVPLHEGLQKTQDYPSILLFSIARTPSREEFYEWVGPFATYNIVLFARTSSKIRIQSEEDLNAYQIGATTADVSVEKLKTIGVSPDHIITDPDPLVLLDMLDEGKIELMTSGDIAGEYFIRKSGRFPRDYTIVYLIEATPLYYVFNKRTSPELITAFREALERLYHPPADGGMSRYEKIMSTWDPAVGFAALTFHTEDYYPYNYQDNGTIQGLSVDILYEILSLLQVPVFPDTLHIGAWDNQYQETLNKTGSVLFSTARTEEREELFLWAGPVFTCSNVIFSRVTQEGEIQPDDILRMRIGAVTNDIGGIDLKEAGVQDIVYKTSGSELIKALERGEIDGWAYAEYPGYEMIARYASDPESIKPVLTLNSNDYYYAFNRETPENLVRVFQQALDSIKKPGPDGISTYDTIISRYTEDILPINRP